MFAPQRYFSKSETFNFHVTLNPINSFILLSFEKMVILEVVLMLALNLALRPNVKYINI